MHSMTFAQRRNRLTTHFSECIPVVKRRESVAHLQQLQQSSVSLVRTELVSGPGQPVRRTVGKFSSDYTARIILHPLTAALIESNIDFVVSTNVSIPEFPFQFSGQMLSISGCREIKLQQVPHIYFAKSGIICDMI